MSQKNPTDRLENLWGSDVLTHSGFTALPSLLLEVNKYLPEEDCLDPVEQLVLINLISFRWSSSSEIFPCQDTLAKRVGRGRDTVSSAIIRLEKKGWLDKQAKGRGHKYNLAATVNKLDLLARQNPSRRRGKEFISQSKIVDDDDF